MIRMRTWLFVTLFIFISTFSITMAGMWALTVWLPGLAKSNPFEATAVIMLFAALITTINLKWFFITAEHGFKDASWKQRTKSTFAPCDCGCGRSCCPSCGVDVGFVVEKSKLDSCIKTNIVLNRELAQAESLLRQTQKPETNNFKLMGLIDSFLNRKW